MPVHPFVNPLLMRGARTGSVRNNLRQLHAQLLQVDFHSPLQPSHFRAGNGAGSGFHDSGNSSLS